MRIVVGFFVGFLISALIFGASYEREVKNKIDDFIQMGYFKHNCRYYEIKAKE